MGCGFQHLVRGYKQELRRIIDEPGNQPGTGNAVHLWVFPGTHFMMTLPLIQMAVPQLASRQSRRIGSVRSTRQHASEASRITLMCITVIPPQYSGFATTDYADRTSIARGHKSGNRSTEL